MSVVHDQRREGITPSFDHHACVSYEDFARLRIPRVWGLGFGDVKIFRGGVGGSPLRIL